jgi:hypothetical protein
VQQISAPKQARLPNNGNLVGSLLLAGTRRNIHRLTQGLRRICPGFALSHDREAKLDTIMGMVQHAAVIAKKGAWRGFLGYWILSCVTGGFDDRSCGKRRVNGVLS